MKKNLFNVSLATMFVACVLLAFASCNNAPKATEENESSIEIEESEDEELGVSRIMYRELDDIAPEDILNNILSAYKGQPVFLDLWATWCGPCRQSHKMMATVKKELADKDIAYVYITDPSSNTDEWEAMAEEIPGDHYLLSKEQFDAILSWHFHSEGIPTYGIFNSKGEQTFSQIGFPGEDVMKAELLKVCK